MMKWAKDCGLALPFHILGCFQIFAQMISHGSLRSLGRGALCQGQQQDCGNCSNLTHDNLAIAVARLLVR